MEVVNVTAHERMANSLQWAVDQDDAVFFFTVRPAPMMMPSLLPARCGLFSTLVLVVGLLLCTGCKDTGHVSSDSHSRSSGSPMAGAPSPAVRQQADEPEFNTEDYAHIEENSFQAVADHPLSTFSIDTDGASYSNVRRFLRREGRLPPPDAVRIEELINYFPYDYPDPEGDTPFSVTMEMDAAPWNPAHRLLHIGLQGERLAIEDRPPTNLVFLLDVSGSMNAPDKLPLLKEAFGLLTEQLTEDDRVSIVVYAGASGVVLPPTSGDQNNRIREALERLEAGGSTAGASGIETAYQLAAENVRPGGINRVIMATDGDFNVGPSSDAALIRLIEEKREDGTFLTMLGFGTNNLKDNKMEQLANHGNGSYQYIDSVLEARKVLVDELGGTLQTIAQDVKIQVEFNPAEVAAYRLIGYENRALAAEDFADDTEDAGEMGAGHSVTALYEIIPVGADTETDVRTTGDLRYQQRDTSAAARSGEWLLTRLRYKLPGGTTSRLIEQPFRPADTRVSTDFHFAAAVAEFGMLLRNSERRGSATYDHALALARDGLGDDTGGYRTAFLDLVRDAQRIADGADTVAGQE